MNPTADAVFQEAMQLPEDSRMSLVERLIVAMSSDHAIESEQVTLAESRMQDLRSGTVQGVPVEDAIRRVRESLGARVSA
ncbi:MAG: addiction module protein [Verrucomicrobia bacterium]|nr:addiction module protein [Verrucomicrobiota bacterium]